MTRPSVPRRVRGSTFGGESPFRCCHCGSTVEADAPGTRHRNHCPHCLWSLHLDLLPGDRRCFCHGAMAPIAFWIRDGGEGALVHRCMRCGTLGSNRIAGDDNLDELRALGRRISDALDAWMHPGGHRDP